MAYKQTFSLIDTYTGKVIERMSYYDSKANDEKYLLPIKKKLEEGTVLITCDCSNKIPLKISNAAYTYPANRNIPHGDDCIRNPKRKNVSIYEKAWSYDEEKGQHIAHIEKPFSIKKETDNKPVYLKDKVARSVGTSYKKGEVTVYGLSTKLNMMAWQNIVEGKKRLPDDIMEHCQFVFGAAKRIRLHKSNQSLQELYYEQKIQIGKPSISKMTPRKDYVFVYMLYQPQFRENIELSTETFKNGKTNHVIYARSPIRKKEIEFYVKDLNEFDQKLRNEPHSDTYILAGFAYRDSSFHHRNLTLGNYCLIPISEKGLFVESSHEKKVFDSFCRHNYLFIKPYYPIEFYADFIPDFIMYEEGKKPIVGEIFGMKNLESYEKQMEAKMRQASTPEFKEKYQFRFKKTT